MSFSKGNLFFFCLGPNKGKLHLKLFNNAFFSLRYLQTQSDINVPPDTPRVTSTSELNRLARKAGYFMKSRSQSSNDLSGMGFSTTNKLPGLKQLQKKTFNTASSLDKRKYPPNTIKLYKLKKLY